MNDLTNNNNPISDNVPKNYSDLLIDGFSNDIIDSLERQDTLLDENGNNIFIGGLNNNSLKVWELTLLMVGVLVIRVATLIVIRPGARVATLSPAAT